MGHHTSVARLAYADVAVDLHDLGRRCSESLDAILADTPVVVHSIPWRVKAQESADRKLIAHPELSSYLDLHDMLGLRVITMFESDLDDADRAIRQLLDVDPARSADRMTSHDASAFGYRSRHFVGTLSAERCRQPEWKRFEGRTIEVQLRTILQHAWAEIEHDLGYKPRRSVSPTARRKFAQLAAITELLDAEFSSLREELDDERTAYISGSAAAPSASEQLTTSSLGALVESDTEINLLDARVATETRQNLLPPGKGARAFSAYLLDACTTAGLHSLQDIHDAIRDLRGEVLAAANGLPADRLRVLDPTGRGLRPGHSLILLAEVLESREPTT